MFLNGKKNIFPAVILRKSIIFPGERIPLVIQGEKTTKSVSDVLDNNRQIVIIFQKNGSFSKIGIIAEVLQYWPITGEILGVTAEGIRRVEITHFFDKEKKAETAEIELPQYSEEELINLEALARNSFTIFKEIIQIEGIIPITITHEFQKENQSPDRICDMITSALNLKIEEKVELLETLDIKKRFEIINKKLEHELNIAKTEKMIKAKAEKEINKTQREYFLKEQLRTIEKELGINENQNEYAEIEKKAKNLNFPQIVQERIIKELHRLKNMPFEGVEVPFIRSYLDWIIDLPWNKKSESELDLIKAKKILDENHFGLEKAKERVLEYLAVQKITKGKGRGSILCFVGPPGTGKTSVGKSIAKALGRNFARISLGGIRDEAEIRGHRRTYVGALPGRIIQSIKNAGTKNPVFMMDEVDKIGTDFRGDPTAALLEVLDSEQNNNFSDHYIELPFDLSEVFFITTANILDPIPLALRDRMEVIEFPGYTDEEKFHIAKKFLIQKVISQSGLSQDQIAIKDGAIKVIIQKYTREAGVRNLERKISGIIRKIAKQCAEGKINKTIIVDEKSLLNYLGPEEFKITIAEAKDEIGVATGLAWTPVGGEIIFIEAALIPGKGDLTLTGYLGEVMQESAKAALSYIRSKNKELKFNQNFYKKNDIHVHVPSGAIPKDGPSAGIAIATALASALSKRKVKKEIALTGEITLSGRILKVGGIKEKVLAAQRAGAKIIILPKENEKNLTEIPEEIKKKIKFQFAEHMDEVLKIAFKK